MSGRPLHSGGGQKRLPLLEMNSALSTRSSSCGLAARSAGSRKAIIARAVELKPLPYAMDAFEPLLSKESFEFHWGGCALSSPLECAKGRVTRSLAWHLIGRSAHRARHLDFLLQASTTGRTLTTSTSRSRAATGTRRPWRRSLWEAGRAARLLRHSTMPPR